MFLDSDDYLELNSCEKLFHKAESEHLDLVVCDFYRVENDKIIEIKIPDFENTTLKDKPQLLLDINLAPWNKLYKRELIINNNIKFVENLKYEDAPFVIETIDKAKKIGKLNEFLNYYIIHKNSETTVRDERVFDIIKIVDRIRIYMKNKDYIKNELDTLTISILMNYNIQQRVQKDWTVGKRFIDESFSYLKKNIPNYRDNIYFKPRGMLKSFIEKNRIITKLYCYIYNK